MEKKENIVAFVRHCNINCPSLGLVLGGEWNGYVAIPPTNKYYGKRCEELDEINVHGGITASLPVINGEFTFMSKLRLKEEYVGKRCWLLAGEIEYITKDTKIGDDWWIIGFDTKHVNDTPETWTKEATIEETKRLMEEVSSLKSTP